MRLAAARNDSTCHSAMSSVWLSVAGLPLPPPVPPAAPPPWKVISGLRKFWVPFIFKKKSKIFFTQLFFTSKKCFSLSIFLCISGSSMPSWVGEARRDTMLPSILVYCSVFALTLGRDFSWGRLDQTQRTFNPKNGETVILRPVSLLKCTFGSFSVISGRRTSGLISLCWGLAPLAPYTSERQCTECGPSNVTEVKDKNCDILGVISLWERRLTGDKQYSQLS